MPRLPPHLALNSEGINIFLAGFVPTENLRFREEALSFKVRARAPGDGGGEGWGAARVWGGGSSRARRQRQPSSRPPTLRPPGALRPSHQVVEQQEEAIKKFSRYKYPRLRKTQGNFTLEVGSGERPCRSGPARPGWDPALAAPCPRSPCPKRLARVALEVFSRVSVNG